MSKSELATVIDAAEERFTQIAPVGMLYDAEKGFAVQLLSNNSFLKKVAQDCPQSLQQAIVNVAAIGLSLNPAKSQAYLITRNVKVGQNQWQSRVFLEPSYRGLCDIITASGTIEWIQADCVYTSDKFEYFGPGERPKHVFDPFATKAERGEFRGAYCVAKTVKGDFLTEMMPAEDVYSIRDRSEAWKAFKEGKAKSGGPWQSDFTQMAKKSVVRRAFKMLPKTKELDRAQNAIHMSNENEGFEPILTEPNVNQFTGDQKAYFDQLIEKGDALGMYCFQNSLHGGDVSGAGYDVWVSLCHSFPKGVKGKYRQIVDSLSERGSGLFEDLVDSFLQHYEEGSETAIRELLEDLSSDAIDLLKTQLEAEHASLIAELTK